MPFCSLCPGRSFTDNNAVRMHTESKHQHPCAKCSRVLHSQQALEQHIEDKHSFFECEYCDREFTTDEGRLAHQKAKHKPMFECRFCDREFSTDHGRDAHEEAMHTFECHHCDRTFNSDEARQQHQDTIHRPTFDCHYCDRTLNSEEARQQHENAKHYFECKYCGKGFTRVEAFRQHEQTVPHVGCTYCTLRFFTHTAKKTHEQSCGCNPVNRIKRPTPAPSDRLHVQFGSLASNAPKLVESVDEESSISAITQHTDKESTSESLASPCSSNSSVDEEEVLYPSTSGISPMDATGEGATVEQPHPCIHLLEPGNCSICQQASSPSLNTDRTVPDDVGTVVSGEDNSTDLRDVIFQCTPCLEVFETKEAFRDHVCAFRVAMFRPHCPICYTQFDDEPLLQKHMEGLQSFSCQLCLTRCCSEEMIQDHLLSHPTCGKCGKSFADDLALCGHVESDHPVVVCWDCDGIVVEMNSLELHYADSSAHSSCAFCGLGKRNSADMDEHVKHMHAEMEDRPEDGSVTNQTSPDEEPTSPEKPGADQEDAARQVFEELDRTPLPSIVEIVDVFDGPSGELHDAPSQTESSPLLTCQPPVSPRVEHDNGEKPSDAGLRRYASPSPTPSEHGSDASQLHLHASVAANSTATNNDTRPPSPVSSVPAKSFSDTSTLSTPTSSSHSVVFVSADGIPDYIRENRAVLVATSAGSPSSGHTPLRLPSSSSLESLEIADPIQRKRAPVVNTSAPTSADNVTHRLHCRICLLDPCDDMTVTICGHLFCRRCITQAVVTKSECPVCKSATLLYCLFKLDISV